MHITTMLLREGVISSSCMRNMMLIIVRGRRLMVVPRGRANLTTLDLTLFFSSKALMVTGRVAELEAVPNAVTIALPMLAMNLEDEGEKNTRKNTRMRK